jgi:ribosome recycling factor
MTDIMSDTKKNMDSVVAHLKEELVAIRTGRANAALVDTLIVSYYGSTVPLKQMASVTVPDAASIVIQPWDKQSLGDIELAIRNSSLGLNPVNEGNQIRLVLPPLTEERRLELVKSIHEKAEAAKVALRTVRKDAWENVQKQVKAGDLTEDDRYSYEDDLNKVIEGYNKQIDEVIADKEKEVKTV